MAPVTSDPRRRVRVCATGATWPQLDFGWSLAEVLERRETAPTADRGDGDGDGPSSPDEPPSSKRRAATDDADGLETTGAVTAATDGRRARGQQFDIGET